MDGSLTFILGGARSGKSAHAEELAAARNGTVLYVATAEAGDDDMAARIAAHRAQRPGHWQTLEAARDVGSAIRSWSVAEGRPDVVLVDCITLLANNVMLALPEPVELDAAERVLRSEIDQLLAVQREIGADWIVVSNEVGLGIVPAYSLGRIYRDVLGRSNQQLAAASTEVLFMVSGLPMVVKSAK